MTIVDRLQAHGIRRLGSPRSGFRYRANGAGRLTRNDRARIVALRIPPAWRDVAIAGDAGAAVQAVGRDAAGRWQYLYHERQVARRERTKRERLVRFIAALPRMRRTVAADLAGDDLARRTVMAGLLQILSTCFLRPGSEVYATENGSYGLATLKRRHVTVRGDVVRFDFRGKSAQRHVREVRDRRLARLVRAMLRHPGEVFKFRGEDGSLVDVRRTHINAYIKEVMGEQFSAKDFRTWAGTLLCACALAREGSPRGLAAPARKRRVVAAIKEVAGHLGNTPAVCRASYVSGAVVERFLAGRVVTHAFHDVAELGRARGRRVERSERALLALLRGEAAA